MTEGVRRLPQTLIFGGSEVKPKYSYPWMGYIYMKDGNKEHGLCGCSLLDPETVLTAAHCIMKRAKPSSFKVHFHRHNLTKESFEEDGEVVNVQSVTVHPGWSKRLLINDFAILKLANPSKSSSFLALDTGGAVAFGKKVKAIGWGLGYNFSPQSTLQIVDMEILPDSVCLKDFGSSLPTFNPKYTICTGTSQGGKNVCFGDSGGPLIVNRNGTWVLVGVTSYGANCRPKIPGVFAKVASQIDWIQSNMKPKTAPSTR
ncbi:trypsin-like serine protease [Basidiobolus meristosporus CBS 931.73]|uniref:Trypsin-like serine protease n=1 Tax=Basidiobolus meristosporus CBS 931.73 TaxID=1314790 RepID=A0A1Y1Z2T9_9FUNG|nr:trypsin-like serine protease [Basidiobolus meristosporus CBS 931.73]|eukprot:ORY04506.1 trypsin-like serine protease [Basidiobolus meristosporus CBS 931.73]